MNCLICSKEIEENQEVMIRAPFSNDIWCNECYEIGKNAAQLEVEIKSKPHLRHFQTTFYANKE